MDRNCTGINLNDGRTDQIDATGGSLYRVLQVLVEWFILLAGSSRRWELNKERNHRDRSDERNNSPTVNTRQHASKSESIVRVSLGDDRIRSTVVTTLSLKKTRLDNEGSTIASETEADQQDDETV